MYNYTPDYSDIYNQSSFPPSSPQNPAPGGYMPSGPADGCRGLRPPGRPQCSIRFIQRSSLHQKSSTLLQTPVPQLRSDRSIPYRCIEAEHEAAQLSSHSQARRQARVMGLYGILIIEYYTVSKANGPQQWLWLPACFAEAKVFDELCSSVFMLKSNCLSVFCPKNRVTHHPKVFFSYHSYQKIERPSCDALSP